MSTVRRARPRPGTAACHGACGNASRSCLHVLPRNSAPRPRTRPVGTALRSICAPTLPAKRSVDTHSSRCAASGQRFATITVRQLPPSASFSAAVSLVCLPCSGVADPRVSGARLAALVHAQGGCPAVRLKGRRSRTAHHCGRVRSARPMAGQQNRQPPTPPHLKGTCASLRASAPTTCSRNDRLLLIAAASRIASPAAPLFFVRSLPARSTSVRRDTWRAGGRQGAGVRPRQGIRAVRSRTLRTPCEGTTLQHAVRAACHAPPRAPWRLPTCASPAQRRRARGCGCCPR